MIPYFFVFVGMPLVTNIWERKIKNNKRNSWILAIIIVLIPSVIAGLRDIKVGVDGEVYVLPYLNMAKTMNFSQFMAIDTIEKGYLLLTYIVSKICNDTNFMFFILQLITSGIILYSGYKFRDKINLTIYVLVFSIYLYTDSLNAMRQSLGIAIFMLSLSYFFEKKYIKTFIAFLIGVLLHNSIASLGIIYLIYFINNKIENKKVKRLSLIALGTTFFIVCTRILNIVYFFSYKLHILSERYYIYFIKIADNTLGFNYFTFLMIFVFIIIGTYITFNKKTKDNITMNLTMLESCIMGASIIFSTIFVGQLGELYRLSRAFVGIGIMFLFAQADKIVKEDKINQTLLILLISALLLSNWVRTYVINGKASLYPYIFKR